MVHHLACGDSAEGGTDAVGHQHEEALGAGTHRGIGLLVDIKRAGDVEEVKGHTVDYARKDEECHARKLGIAQTEETETEHPADHGYHHHALDAETFETEGNEQDAEGFGNLRERYEGSGIVGHP